MFFSSIPLSNFFMLGLLQNSSLFRFRQFYRFFLVTNKPWSQKSFQKLCTKHQTTNTLQRTFSLPLIKLHNHKLKHRNPTGFFLYGRQFLFLSAIYFFKNGIKNEHKIILPYLYLDHTPFLVPVSRCHTRKNLPDSSSPLFKFLKF